MDEQVYISFQKLIYPTTLIIILFLFKNQFSHFIENLGKLSVKAGNSGISVTAEIMGNTIGYVVESSLNKLASVEQNNRNQYISNTVKGIETTIEKLQSNIGKLNHKKIIWVDDHPENNISEIKAFETMGITIITSLNNEDALKKIKKQNYDLIISDYFSDDGFKKGLSLLKQIFDLGYNTPLIFYTGRATRDIKTEAENNGAFGIVDTSGELSALVLKCLIEINIEE